MNASVSIRPQRPEDAEVLVDVHLRSWRWAYTGLIPDSYIDLLWSQREERVARTRRNLLAAGPDERFWLAERGGEVVGLAYTHASGDDDAERGIAEVGALYLVPEAAGAGIGRQLLARAVDDIRARGFQRATLWVLVTNDRARRFYEAAGWHADGKTKTEQRPGATLDEVRYAIDLLNAPASAGRPFDPAGLAANSHIELIESLAPRAWPAETIVDLDGWSLRRTPGELTRRANSALPNEHRGRMAPEEKINAVEAYFGGTDHPPRFQITPLAAPRELDRVLESRGYLIDAPTVVMTADWTGPKTQASDVKHFATVLRDRVDDDWLATLYGGEPGEQPNVLRTKILDRIEPTTIYARVLIDGQSAAVGLGVLDTGWVGIYCVATMPKMRRRGAATAVMAALLHSAADRGANAAYLGVLEENFAARALYERLGFRTLYRYHYRWLPSGGVA